MKVPSFPQKEERCNRQLKHKVQIYTTIQLVKSGLKRLNATNLLLWHQKHHTTNETTGNSQL